MTCTECIQKETAEKLRILNEGINNANETQISIIEGELECAAPQLAFMSLMFRAASLKEEKRLLMDTYMAQAKIRIAVPAGENE